MVPTIHAVKGTVRLSSNCELIGRDSTMADARDTKKYPITMPQLSSIKPNIEK